MAHTKRWHKKRRRLLESIWGTCTVSSCKYPIKPLTIEDINEAIRVIGRQPITYGFDFGYKLVDHSRLLVPTTV